MIYANCGCYLGPGEVKGSMRHPCYTECFTKVWEDDEEAYLKWLDKKYDD